MLSQKNRSVFLLVICYIVVLPIAFCYLTKDKGIEGKNPDKNPGNIVEETNNTVETLEIVSTTDCPDRLTFAYTESSDPGMYAVAKRATKSGGTLSVSFDPKEYCHFEIKIYLFDRAGQAAFLTDEKQGTFQKAICMANAWVLPKRERGFAWVDASFKMPIPEGYTAMVCIKCDDEQIQSPVGNPRTCSDFADWMKNGGLTITRLEETITVQDNTKYIGHRGYSGGRQVPMNSLTSYQLAKQFGFHYVETDVLFTQDNVPVLYHDKKIDKVLVSKMSYEQVSQCDIGTPLDERYAGERIPKFEDFLALCKKLELCPYVELKVRPTQEQYVALFAIIDKLDMRSKITWITFDANTLKDISQMDENARLGLCAYTLDDQTFVAIQDLKTLSNEVFLDLQMKSVTEDTITICKNSNIPIELWGVGYDQAQTDESLNPYISGITCDDFAIINARACFQENAA